MAGGNVSVKIAPRTAFLWTVIHVIESLAHRYPTAHAAPLDAVHYEVSPLKLPLFPQGTACRGATTGLLSRPPASIPAGSCGEVIGKGNYQPKIRIHQLLLALDFRSLFCVMSIVTFSFFGSLLIHARTTFPSSFTSHVPHSPFLQANTRPLLDRTCQHGRINANVAV